MYSLFAMEGYFPMALPTLNHLLVVLGTSSLEYGGQAPVGVAPGQAPRHLGHLLGLQTLHPIFRQPIQLIRQPIYLLLPRTRVCLRVRHFRSKDFVHQGDDWVLLGGRGSWSDDNIVPSKSVSAPYLQHRRCHTVLEAH